MRLYWDLAERIVAKQKTSAWGDGFLAQMSRDLQNEFPEMKGFSLRNLKYIRQWFQFWSDEAAIGQQLVAQIPWGHNLVIISKTKNADQALFYVKQTIQNNWSRAVLAPVPVLRGSVAKLYDLIIFTKRERENRLEWIPGSSPRMTHSG